MKNVSLIFLTAAQRFRTALCNSELQTRMCYASAFCAYIVLWQLMRHHIHLLEYFLYLLDSASAGRLVSISSCSVLPFFGISRMSESRRRESADKGFDARQGDLPAVSEKMPPGVLLPDIWAYPAVFFFLDRPTESSQSQPMIQTRFTATLQSPPLPWMTVMNLRILSI